MFYLIAIVVIVIDQLSKIWIRMNVAIGESFQLWNSPITITHYENSGAAFSSFQGYGRWFVPVAVFVVVFLMYYRKREGKRKLLDLGAGFLAGGAIGNAIDRVLFNQVTDFITFKTSNGILNIADYALNIGLVLIIVDTVNTELIQKKKSKLNTGGNVLNQALLIIDAQQALIDGDGHFEKGVVEKERLLSTINKVIEKAKAEQVPVIFIRDTDVAGGEGAGFEVHPEIHIPKEAVTFNKAATNSFYGTPLLHHLKERTIKHLVIMGCKTEYCIDTTVRTATVNGFDVTLVGDGHSTSHSDTLTGEQIIQHHNRVLNGFDNVDHFSLVRNGDDELFQPKHNDYR